MKLNLKKGDIVKRAVMDCEFIGTVAKINNKDFYVNFTKMDGVPLSLLNISYSIKKCMNTEFLTLIKKKNTPQHPRTDIFKKCLK